jgi:hypothetical protein
MAFCYTSLSDLMHNWTVLKRIDIYSNLEKFKYYTYNHQAIESII